MHLLIHICCADCFARTLAGLRVEFGGDLKVYGIFHNPNIHPLLEFRRRMKSVQVYCERDPVKVECDTEYGLVAFCNTVHPDYAAPERCRHCYRMRLQHVAERAAEQGFTAFTSTLVTSRHQDHDAIRSAGEEAGRDAGVEFLYRDLREAVASQKLVTGLYRQQYCGCAFSEEERFAPTGKYLYKGDSCQ